MLLAEERRRLVRFGEKLVAAGLTAGSGGNLSTLDPEQGLVAATPSGMDYAEIRPEDVVVLDHDGAPVEGSRKPTSELALHLALYRARPDVRAVVHTHSPYATTLACLRWELPAVHYLVGFSGDKVPLAPYATFGTDELARGACEALGSYNAVLLANHGVIAVGPDLARAFATAEEVEFVARVYWQCRAVGDPTILSAGQMEEVLAAFRTYGQQDPP